MIAPVRILRRLGEIAGRAAAQHGQEGAQPHEHGEGGGDEDEGQFGWHRSRIHRLLSGGLVGWACR